MANYTRRNFLKQTILAAGGAVLPIYGFSKNSNEIGVLKDLSSGQNVGGDNEDYWQTVRNAYNLTDNFINLNNGGVSPQPKVVSEAFLKFNAESIQAPSYYLWRVQNKQRIETRARLENLINASQNTVALTRNTTESLSTIIFGLDLNKGDEVVLSKYDYPHVIASWKQRQQRDGIVLKWVDFKFPVENEQSIINAFSNQIDEKTRVVCITQIINYTGQILPVEPIVVLAQKFGALTMVDGAHSLIQLPVDVTLSDCDFYGSSLHKWLGAPLGTGLMYVKEDSIESVWPLHGAPIEEANRIEKFNHLGTRSFAKDLAINNALSFHFSIGSTKRQKRLQYLKNYWLNKALNINGLATYTSQNPKFGASITTIYFKNKDFSGYGNKLFKDFNIHTTTVNHENVNGIRVSPNVYTSLWELDKLVDSLQKLSKL